MATEQNFLYGRYKNMPLPAKAALWFAVCSFLQRGISMLTTPVFTRLLPTEEYGKYSTYLSWETILLMVVSLCLHKALMNLYIKYENKEQVLSAVAGLTLILTCSWLGIAVLFCKKISEAVGLSPILILCMFVYFIFEAVIQCWSVYKRYIYDYRPLVAVTMFLTAGSAILGGISVIYIEATAEARAIGSTIAVILAGFPVYFQIFKSGHRFVNKEIWKFALVFCISLMPHYLSEFILQSSDKIMIHSMCGSRDAAIYSVGYSVGSVIGLVTNAVNATFAPYQYQKMKSGEYERLANRADAVLVFVGIMLCGIMLFGKEIVLIFGGRKYIDSVDVIIPICIGSYFNYMFQIFARVQEYYERKMTVVIPSILCAVLNFLLNLVFIRIYGYKAAAYTTLLSYMIFCIIHYFFYRKICKEELNGIQVYHVKVLMLTAIGVMTAGFIIVLIR